MNITRWEELPPEILLQFFIDLDVRDLVATAGVCTTWRQCAQDKSIWKIRKQSVDNPTVWVNKKLPSIHTVSTFSKQISLIACSQLCDTSRYNNVMNYLKEQTTHYIRTVACPEVDEEINTKDIIKSDITLQILARYFDQSSKNTLLHNMLCDAYATYNKRDHTAPYQRIRAAITTLLSMGAIPNNLCIDSPTQWSDYQLVKLLLAHGANPQTINPKDINYKPAFFSAKNVPLAQLFIDHGANLKSTDKDGNTITHHIAKNSSYSAELMELYAQHGAPVNTKNNFGYAPIHYIGLAMDNPNKRDMCIKKLKMLIAAGAQTKKPITHGPTHYNCHAGKTVLDIAHERSAKNKAGHSTSKSKKKRKENAILAFIDVLNSRR